MVTKAKRQANNKWDADHMKAVGCRVRSGVAEEFHALCQENGTTANAVLKNAVQEYIKRHGGKDSGSE